MIPFERRVSVVHLWIALAGPASTSGCNDDAPGSIALAGPRQPSPPVAPAAVATPSLQREHAAEVPVDDLALLAMVNEPVLSRAQPYPQRHAWLERLAVSPDAGRVDRRLNLALDLLQAAQAPRPCAVFREALGRIEASKDRYYTEFVERSRPPTARDQGSTVDEPCDELEGARVAVIQSLEHDDTADTEAMVDDTGQASGAAGDGNRADLEANVDSSTPDDRTRSARRDLKSRSRRSQASPPPSPSAETERLR